MRTSTRRGGIAVRFKIFPLVIVMGLLLPWQVIAAETVDERKPASADGYVSINVVRGEVDVRGWDNDEIHVTGRLDEATRRFTFEVNGDEADIEVEIKDGTGWFDGDSSDLTIFIPSGSQLSMSGVSTDVSARSVTGSVEMALVSGDVELRGGNGRVDIQTVSGDIDIRDATGRLRIKTVSGEVEAVETSGDSVFSSVSGDVVIEDAGNELTIETVSGDVEVITGDMTVLSGHSISGDVEIAGDLVGDDGLEFDSVSGDIRVKLGGAVDADFDIETGSGTIRNRLTDDEPRVAKYGSDEALRFRMGEGVSRVTITTRSGDIYLAPR